MSATAPLSGRTLGDFVVREKLGEGGFGVVYVAEQPALGRDAVIKVLHGRHRKNDVTTRRFLREAKLASRLDHPYAAHIYAFGVEADELLWIAMERVKGTPLGAWLGRHGAMSVERLVPLLERICEVVQTAHEQGIVHRDLKPDNVMVLERAGRLLPKLLDFGIAKLVAGEEEASDAPAGADEAAPTLTQGGKQVGSPAYMSPEQWQGTTVDGRADIYALGILAFEALTARLPFPRKDLAALARAHAQEALPPLGPSLPPALDAVLAKACAKRPDGRFATAGAFAAAFRAAAGLAAEPEAIPRLDPGLRALTVHTPQPIAESLALLDAARNVHQARDAFAGVVRVIVRYLGVVALACQSRFGGGVGERVRALRRVELDDEGWLELLHDLCRDGGEGRFPLPELVAFMSDGASLARVVGHVRKLHAAAGDATMRAALGAELVDLARLLRELAFLSDYQLVVPTGGAAELWMGTRRPRRLTIPMPRPLPDGQAVLVNLELQPVVSLAPLVQAHPPTPGAPEELFLFAGRGRLGARLVAEPKGFEHHDEEVWAWFAEHFATAEDTAETQPEAAAPYRGLAAFTADDAGMFFGRERAIEALLNRLRVQPFIAVVGPSGAGKSSFVQAGVIPALPEGWHAVVVRPGARIDDEERPLLVVVDQLEELFTLNPDPAARDAFAERLAALARDPDGDVRVVVTLRDDFLVRAEGLPALRDLLAQGLVLLGTPAAADLRRILIEPARRLGFDFDDPALPDRMVTEVADRPGALALLSFTAARLWDARDRHFRQLSRKAYDALGGVGGALAQHAETTLAELPAEEQRLVREAFRRLVTAEGTRATLTHAELVQVLGGDSHAAAVVEKLVAARLLQTYDAEDAQRIEIVHEALLQAWPRLVGWRREDLEGARLRDQLHAAARQWDERGRARGLLWRADALDEYRRWRARWEGKLPEVDQAFAGASLREAARGRRRRTGLAAAAFVLLTAGLVAVTTLYQRSRTSEEQTRSTLVTSYVEQGRRYLLDGNPQLGLPYLAEAYAQGARGAGLSHMIGSAVRALEAERATLPADDMVSSVRFSPDGERILTAGADGVARLWDRRGAPLAVLRGHEDWVWSAVFDRGGERVATTSFDGTARIWRVRDGALLAILRGHGARVYAVDFDEAGARVVTASRDGTARIWSAAGELLQTLEGHHAQVDFAFFLGEGRRVVTGGRDGHAKLWDADTGRLLLDVEAGPPGYTFVTRTADPTRLLTANGRRAILWDTAAGTPLVTCEESAEVSGADASHDGRLIVTTGDQARLWDARTGLSIRALATASRVVVATFSPDDRFVAAGGQDGKVFLFTTRTSAPYASFVSHTNAIRALAFSPDGAWLASASMDHTARLWEVRGAMAYAFAVPQLESLDFSDGEHVVAATHHGRWTWPPSSAAPPDQHLVAVHGAKSVVVDGEGLTLSPAGVRLSSRTGARVIASFSPDGARLVTAVEDRRAGIWDTGPGAALTTSVDHGAPIQDAAFSHDGGRLATAGDDARGRIFDARSGRLLATLEGHTARILSISWSRDDRRLITAGFDQTARVWDAATGTALRTIEGTPISIAAVAQDVVATIALGDTQVRLWDLDTGGQIGSFAQDISDELDLALAFSADGRQLAVGSHGQVVVWRLDEYGGTPEQLTHWTRCHVPYRVVDGHLVHSVTRCD